MHTKLLCNEQTNSNFLDYLKAGFKNRLENGKVTPEDLGCIMP